ncbi:Fc receptor-like protein 5 isoform X2 [Brachyhypopomus gauderio]|uniref:Fc receptor-like protein 5 isoform X2 n=1 Tax=Brachyhypopomus gauderio TaxID=698409 RepID=UPI0040422B8E
MELGPFPVMLLLIVLIHCVQPQELKKAVISTNPANPVYVGENVNLTCLVEGDSVNTFHYHWKKEDSVSPPTSEQVHKINSVEESHAGNYTCEVTAYDGSHYSQTTDVLTLTVLVPPEASITTWPQSSMFTGEPVSLNCEVKGFNGWKYNWYKKNTATSLWTSVTESENYTINKHGLNISRDAVVNGDKYRCRGERFHRPSTTQYSPEVTIIAKALPRATISVDPQGPVFTGESVTLKCEVKAFDGWTYQWDKHGETQQWIPLVQSVHYTVNRDTVIISRDSVVNGEQYRCRGERPGRPSASQYSTVTLTVKAVKPKPELTSSLQGAALIGNPVILYCKLEQSAGWRFYWSKHTQNPDNETSTETSSTIISSVTSSDGGQYWCRAGRGNPVYYTHYSDALWIKAFERPKPELVVNPDKIVFKGETVTLICNIEADMGTKWTYRWYKDSNKVNKCRTTRECTIGPVTEADGGKYTCSGQRSDSQSSDTSDVCTLTVSDAAQVVLRRSTQSWLAEGDPVNLSCEVRGSSTGWTFSWYRDEHTLLPDSIRGAGGSYTVSSAAVNHTGVYVCRAERGEPAYQTHYSNPQTLWVTGISPRVSLVISPNRSKHSSGDSLSLSCEDQRGSTGWRVRRYTDIGRVSDCSSGWGSVTGSTCTISSLSTSHTGVYWCQSESGGTSNPSKIQVLVSGESHTPMSILRLLSILLPASLFLLMLIVLGFRCYRARAKPDKTTRKYTVGEAETSS